MNDLAGPTLDLEILGTHFRLLAHHPSTRDALAQQWRRCLVAPAPDAVEVEVGDEPGFDEGDGYGLASQLTLQAIGRAMGTRLMLHAAGLASETGEVIALVAPSGTGKTTAVRTLCTTAFGYVTDETVSVGEELDVLPFAKPLSLVGDDAAPYVKTQHGPDDLGLLPAPPDLRLVRLVLLDRHETPTAPSLTPVGLLEGLLDLMQQVSGLALLPDPLQLLCRTAERCGGIQRLSYDDIRSTSALLTGSLRASAEGPDGAVVDPGDAWQPWRPTGRPAHWTDAVTIGGEALVLIDNQPVRLGPLGRTVLEVLLTGGDEATALAAATRDHGPHPEAAALVAEAVQAARAADLLPAR